MADAIQQPFRFGRQRFRAPRGRPADAGRLPGGL